MISEYFMFAVMALIFSAIIMGIVSDCKQFKKRLNALKQPIKNDGLDDWFNERDKIAFDELKEEV